MIAVTFALPAESSGFVARRPQVLVLHTGVGKRAVERTLPAFLEKHSPSLLISAGFAGAATDSLEVGAVFVAENFSDPALAAKLPLAKAKLATLSRIADTPNERLAGSADAVDMETEFIAAECARRGIPMLSLRAISDTPAAPFGIPAEVLFDVERQRTKGWRLLAYVVKHPFALGRLITVARQVRVARASLACALEAVYVTLL